MDNNMPNNYEYTPVVEEKKDNVMAIVGLVLGILALPINCCYGIGIIFAIVGLILSIIGMKKNKSGLAIAALIVNILAILMGVAAIIYYVVIIVASLNNPEYQSMIQDIINSSSY